MKLAVTGKLSGIKKGGFCIDYGSPSSEAECQIQTISMRQMRKSDDPIFAWHVTLFQERANQIVAEFEPEATLSFATLVRETAEAQFKALSDIKAVYGYSDDQLDETFARIEKKREQARQQQAETDEHECGLCSAFHEFSDSGSLPPIIAALLAEKLFG